MQAPSSLHIMTPDDYKAATAAFEQQAATFGHHLTITGATMDDQANCSCGWHGTAFWDGRDLARAEWEQHVATVSGDGQVVMNF